MTPLERALAYLDKLPPANSGSGGHAATFRAACALVRVFNLDADDMRQAMAWWNANRCNPAWSDAELEHKIKDARRLAGTAAAAPVRHAHRGRAPRPPVAAEAVRALAAQVRVPGLAANRQETGGQPEAGELSPISDTRPAGGVSSLCPIGHTAPEPSAPEDTRLLPIGSTAGQPCAVCGVVGCVRPACAQTLAGRRWKVEELPDLAAAGLRVVGVTGVQWTGERWTGDPVLLVAPEITPQAAAL